MSRAPGKVTDHAWMQGYACCLATAVRMEGCWNTHHDELLAAAGGVEAFRAANIDEHDAEVIFNPDWSRSDER